MNTQDKKVFVASLISRVEEYILDKCDRMPEGWNADELLVVVASQFEEEAALSELRRFPRSDRARKFKCVAVRLDL